MPAKPKPKKPSLLDRAKKAYPLFGASSKAKKALGTHTQKFKKKK